MNDHSNAVTGFTIGLPAEFRFAKALAMQAELAFMQRGGTLDAGGVTTNYTFNYRVTSMDLSILVKPGIPIKDLRINFLVGPCLSNGLSVTRTDVVETSGGNNASSPVLNPVFGQDEDEFSRLDVSLVAGGGASYAFGRHSVFVEARYMHGFFNVFGDLWTYTDQYGNALGDGRVTSRAWMGLAGYMFRLGKERDPPSTK